MKALKLQYECSHCGFTTTKWMGKCPECHSWSSFVESSPRPPEGRSKGLSNQAKPQKLSEISTQSAQRLNSGISELDRALGGGLVPGSLVLIGGDPGIGKSTLLLQALSNTAAAGIKSLYVTGEESPEQVKLRSQRLDVPGSELFLFCETHLGRILQESVEVAPQILVIDSIQTLYKEELPGTPGSISQIRDCTMELMIFCKAKGCVGIIVGHITKDGQIAGPKMLEHMVDTVLYFEGERNSQFRLLRCIKNRFGPTHEVGVFEMLAKGLASVSNPSQVFIQNRSQNTIGSVVSCTFEGTRTFLYEVQALVNPTPYSVPQKVALGFDSKKLTILLALLEKFGEVHIGASDVFVSLAGGLKCEDPAMDLGILCAIWSNHLGHSIPKDLIILGELGLSGEIRPVGNLLPRIQEVVRLGFKQIMLPQSHNKATKDASANGVHYHYVDHLSSALECLNELAS